MQVGLEKIQGYKGTGPISDFHEVYFAGSDRTKTDASSHRDFESDPKTMNDILNGILQMKTKAASRFSDVHFTSYRES